MRGADSRPTNALPKYGLVGYGHTGNVRPDDIITQDEAEELLKRDLKVHEDNVKRLVKVW